MGGARGIARFVLVLAAIVVGGSLLGWSAASQEASQEAPFTCPPTWPGTDPGQLASGSSVGWSAGSYEVVCRYEIGPSGSGVSVDMELRWDPPERQGPLAPLACHIRSTNYYEALSPTHQVAINARARGGSAPADVEQVAEGMLSLVEPVAAPCQRPPSSSATCPGLLQPEGQPAWTVEHGDGLDQSQLTGPAGYSLTCAWHHPDDAQARLLLDASWQVLADRGRPQACEKPGAVANDRVHSQDRRALVQIRTEGTARLGGGERQALESAALDLARALLASVEGSAAACLQPTPCPGSTTVGALSLDLIAATGPLPDHSKHHATEAIVCWYGEREAPFGEQLAFEVEWAVLDPTGFWACTEEDDAYVVSPTHPVIADPPYMRDEADAQEARRFAQGLLGIGEARVADCQGTGGPTDDEDEGVSGEVCASELAAVAGQDPWLLREETQDGTTKASVILQELTCIYAPDAEANGGFATLMIDWAQRPSIDGPWGCGPPGLRDGGLQDYRRWSQDHQATADWAHTEGLGSAVEAMAEDLLADLEGRGLRCDAVCPPTWDFDGDGADHLRQPEAWDQFQDGGYNLAELTCTYDPPPSGGQPVTLTFHWAETLQWQAWGCRDEGSAPDGTVWRQTKQIIGSYEPTEGALGEGARTLTDHVGGVLQDRALDCLVVCPAELEGPGGEAWPLRAQRSDPNLPYGVQRTVCVFAPEEVDARELAEAHTGPGQAPASRYLALAVDWIQALDASWTDRCLGILDAPVDRGQMRRLDHLEADLFAVWWGSQDAMDTLDPQPEAEALMAQVQDRAAPCRVHCIPPDGYDWHPSAASFYGRWAGRPTSESLTTHCRWTHPDGTGLRAIFTWHERPSPRGPVACDPLEVRLRGDVPVYRGPTGRDNLATLGSHDAGLTLTPGATDLFEGDLRSHLIDLLYRLEAYAIPCIEAQLGGSPCLDGTATGEQVGVVRFDRPAVDRGRTPPLIWSPETGLREATFDGPIYAGEVLLSNGVDASWTTASGERGYLSPWGGACLGTPTDRRGGDEHVMDLLEGLLVFEGEGPGAAGANRAFLSFHGVSLTPRGTTFAVLADRQAQAVTIYLEEGAVELTDEAGTVLQLRPGQKVTEAAGHLFTATALPPAEWDAVASGQARMQAAGGASGTSAGDATGTSPPPATGPPRVGPTAPGNPVVGPQEATPPSGSSSAPGNGSLEDQGDGNQPGNQTPAEDGGSEQTPAPGLLWLLVAGTVAAIRYRRR